MVTANGEKVSHGHAFQSTTNQDDWYFTAKINGVQLKPQKMDAADLAAYQKKEMTVPQLMERYYPTKLMPKVSEEAFRMPKELAGPDGAITIDKFNVYKEKDEQRPDFGKYKFYAQMGDTKMSVVASKEDLNAYFDRVVSPTQLVEKNFGERLHLKSAYEKYQLPEGVDPKGVRVAKDHADNKWKVSMDLGEKGKTSKHEISFDDGYSLFKAKTATREQIAAKYLNTEITGMLSTVTNKMEKTASLKM
ncbi:MutS domain I protein [gut metagenome]|uniref:MutS domain I protein n=1 Tax=gut metagenome TaxID=749906 RepID=J9FRX0_9ZZZZ